MPDTIDDTEEHPIIFNKWSINRILAGEKTQTRRIVKPQPPENADKMEVGQESPHGYPGGEYGYHNRDGKAVYGMPCPYGQPGDVLWVREGFRMPVGCDDKYTPKEYISSSGYTQGVPGRFRYEADGKRAYEVAGNRDACAVEWGRLRPAIHMPKELCRLHLRVEDVRVERVQGIGETDAAAEGIPSMAPQEASRIPAFKRKWNDIHGDGAWERNDWVWAVEFSQTND